MSNSIDKIAEQMKTAQQTQPVAAPPVPAPTTATPQTKPSGVPVTQGDILKLLQDVADLKKAKDAQAVAKAVTKKPDIDWSKISEKDITNLDIDIPVIEQERPAYLEVHLLDKNYIPRWIHQMPQRLGICLSEGYMYVKKEDMDPNYPIPLAFDTSGNYSHGDVVCLKILKSRYYPALKANYMKTMAIHGKSTLKKAIERGKSGVQLDKKGNEIIGGLEPEQLNSNGFDIYDPGSEPTKGEREFTRDMVQV